MRRLQTASRSESCVTTPTIGYTESGVGCTPADSETSTYTRLAPAPASSLPPPTPSPRRCVALAFPAAPGCAPSRMATSWDGLGKDARRLEADLDAKLAAYARSAAALSSIRSGGLGAPAVGLSTATASGDGKLAVGFAFYVCRTCAAPLLRRCEDPMCGRGWRPLLAFGHLSPRL